MEPQKTTGPKTSDNSTQPSKGGKAKRKRRPEDVLASAKRHVDDLMVELQEFPEFQDDLQAFRKRVLDRKREEEERLPF